MMDFDKNIRDQLDAYLDGQLEEGAQKHLQDQIDTNPELAAEVKLQQKIDDSLKRSFSPTSSLDLSFLTADATDSPAEEQQEPVEILPMPQARSYKPAMLVLAASVAWVAVAWQLFWSGGAQHPDLAFRERPLTDIYEQCVSEGFKPYWVCENDRIFAATFETRQGVPLNLTDLPEGRRMVGLSYLAGVSRKSTSLLAMVDEKPVIVFVDRADRDWNPPTGFFADKGLSVTKVEKHGLILYEVSPFRYTTVVDFLRPPTHDPSD